jgi:hypothetical protein
MNVKVRDCYGFRVIDYPDTIDLPQDVKQEIRDRIGDKSLNLTTSIFYRSVLADQYCISTEGEIFSRSQRNGYAWKKLTTLGATYQSVILRLPASLKEVNNPDPLRFARHWLVHRLVMYAFCGASVTDETYDVRHLDGNNRNNRLYNLSYGTKKENMADIVSYVNKKDRVKEAARVVTPKPVYTLNPEDVKNALIVYKQAKLTLKQLAELMRVSSDVAKSILCGNLYKDVRNELGIEGAQKNRAESNYGVSGERHYKALFTEIQLKEAFSLYIEHHWSGVQFSRFLGVNQLTGHMILKGKNWKHVPRPEGFIYPWPDSRTMNARRDDGSSATCLSDEQLTELFSDIVAGKYNNVREIREKYNMLEGLLYGLLSGKQRKSVPRPEGFEEAATKLFVRKRKEFAS